MGKKLIDLFAGCGGLSLGLENAGFEVAFASDINETCLKTYQINRNLPDEKCFIGDIHDLNKNFDNYSHLFKDISLVCGGPPCQGFSIANRQRIIDDPRNVLYKEYLEFLSKVRPPFFIMENVRGMMNKEEEIMDDIHNILGNEYDVCPHIFNAVDFGVPQNRERVIFIGNRIGVSSRQVIQNIISYSKTCPKYVLKDALQDLPELGINPNKNASSIENDVVGFFKKEYDYPNSEYFKFINNGRNVTAIYNHKNRYNNERDIEIYKRLPQGANSLHESIADIMPYKSRNEIFKDKYFKLREDEPCKTITAHMKFDCNMYIHPTQPRGLSPREAARIQTFPDDFVFYGPQNSWYMQAGNAVPVKLAEAIGKEVIKYL